MLKAIDPILSPDLLRALRAMGHGDDIAIVDGNYPAEAAGRTLLRMDGHSATRALEAILSVLPLDDFVPHAAWVMQPVDAPDREEPIFGEFQALVDRHEGSSFRLAKLERFAFYAQAAKAFAVVATGERRLYGNIILRKGVIRPENAGSGRQG